MKEIVLNVKGMACEGCENRIQKVIKDIEGVDNVKADHNSGKVVIKLNREISIEVLVDTITDIGYEVIKED